MNEINISRLVDTTRLRPFHFWLAFWCLLAMMADGFDLLNASIAGPALIKQWGIDRAALGPVFSASLVGFFVGAPFFGWFGDRFGRRLAIISSLLFIGVTTLACAFATDLHELLWLRFFSGLGLGGVLPNVIALNAEFTPKRLRATMLVVMSMGISLGAAVPGIVGVTLMPTYGWPMIFVVGGLIPFVVGSACFSPSRISSNSWCCAVATMKRWPPWHANSIRHLTVPLGTRFVLDRTKAARRTRFTDRSVPRRMGAGDGAGVADLRSQPDGQQPAERLAADDCADERPHRRARQLRRFALSARRLGRRTVHRHLDRPVRAESAGDYVRYRGAGAGVHWHAGDFGCACC